MSTPPKQELRADPAVFAKHYFDIELLGWQRKFIAAKQRFVIGACGRGAGKSVGLAVKVLWEAFRREGFTVLVISGGLRQVKHQIGETINDQLGESELGGSVTKNTTEEIRLTNGSRIYFLPSGKPGKIRGYHAKLKAMAADKPRGVLVVIDEMCFVERGKEIWNALEFVLLSADPAQVVAAGTTTSRESWAYTELWRHWEDKDPDFFGINATSFANLHIPEAELKKIEKRRDSATYTCEILAEWVEDFGSWFGGGVLDRAVTKRFTLGAPVKFTQEELHKGWREVDLDDPSREAGQAFARVNHDVLTASAIGLDRSCSWGKGTDRTAVACVTKVRIDWDGVPFYVLSDLRSWDRVTDETILATIQEMEKTFGPTKENPSHGVRSWELEQYQAASLAETLSQQRPKFKQWGGKGQFTKGVRVEAASAPRQMEVFTALHEEMSAGRFLIPETGPEAVELLREMKNFGFEIMDGGTIRFGKTAGQRKGKIKDDRVYAVAWAFAGARGLNVSILPP